MRKILVFFILLCGFYVFGQNSDRIWIKGKIAVEKNDVEGIVIRNKSSNVFVVTTEAGEFLLKVKLNDIIEVSALQYQNISFSINEAVINSGIMKVYLVEEINKLDEIIISSNTLSGDLTQDINKVNDFKAKEDIFYFGIKNNQNISIAKSEKINNVALDPNHNVARNPERQIMINGLNIVNVVDQVLLPLFRSEVKDKKVSGLVNVPKESIKYFFGSEFLIDNFNIPEHRIQEFIRFVEDENFDTSLLNYGKEMELLELINQKSIMFLNTKK